MADRLAKYDEYYKAASAKYGIPVEELKAITDVESNGDPHAVSPMGAQGLMQVMPMHTRGAKDPFDPAYNIDTGAKVLRDSYSFMRKNGVPEDQLQRAAWAGYDRAPEKVLATIQAGGSPDSGTDRNRYATAVGEALARRTGDQPEATPAVTKSAAAPDDSDQIKLRTLPNGKVVFQNRVGEYSLVDAKDAADAYYNRKLTPVDPDKYAAEKTEEYLHEKYGKGLGNALKAAGEGGLNGLLGEAGDAFLAASGIEAKDAIKAHSKYFGGTKKLAEFGTLGATLLDGEGEASLAERGTAAAEREATKLPEAGEAARGLDEATQAAKKIEAGGAAYEKTIPNAKFDTAVNVPAGRGGIPRPEPKPGAAGLYDVAGNPVDVPDKTVSDTADTVAQNTDTAVNPTNYNTVAPKATVQDHPAFRSTGTAIPKFKPGAEGLYDVGGNRITAENIERGSFGEAANDTPTPTRAERGLASGDNTISEQTPAAPEDTAVNKTTVDNTAVAPADTVADHPAFAGLEKTISEVTRAAPEDTAVNTVANGPGYNTAIDRVTQPEDTAGNTGANGPDYNTAVDQVTQPEPTAVNPPVQPKIGIPPPQMRPGAVGLYDVAGNKIGAEAIVPGAPGPAATEVNTVVPGVEPNTVVGGEPMNIPGRAQVPPPAPIPVAPAPAPMDDASFFQTLHNIAATPNKTIFGIGKQFGTAIEDATGSKLLGHFARGAAESVPFTVGHNLSEATLNDEKITPERLFAGGMGNALLGGTLSAGLGLAAEGLHKLNLHFADLAGSIGPKERVQQVAQSLNGVFAASEKISKALYQDGLKYARVRQILGDADNLVKQAGPKPWLDLHLKTANAFDRSSALGNTGAAKLARQAYDEYAAKLNTPGLLKTNADVFEAADTLKNRFSDLAYELRQTQGNEALVKELKSFSKDWNAATKNPAIFGDAAKLQANLNKAWRGLIEKNGKKSPIAKALMRRGLLNGEGEMVFDEGKIHKLISDLASEHPINSAHGEMNQQILKEYLEANEKFLGTVKSEVYEPLGRGGEIEPFHSAVGGEDGAVAKSLDSMKDMTDAQKKQMWVKLAGDRNLRLGAAGALMMAGVPHAFLVTWTVSAALEKLVGIGLGKSGFGEALADHGQRFSAVLTREMEKAFTKGSDVAPAAVGLFSKYQPTEKPITAKDRHEQVAEVAQHLAAAVNDPELPQKLAQGTKLLSIAHPELAVALQMQTMNAVNYLHAQAPKDPLPPSPFNTVPFRPGHAETARFENVAEVVMDPLTLVRNFGNGTLTAEQVATAEAVYPEITSKIRQLATEGLAKYGKGMPYRKQLAFARLMGSPMDWSTQPDSVQALQAVYKMPPPGSGDPSKGGKANRKKDTPRPSNSVKGATLLSEEAKTGLQSALARV